MILQFANCELDTTRVVLRRDGKVLHIEPQAFDVLSYLVERRGQVVRKTELLDHIWGDRFVSESALTTQIKSVRHAVGDDGNVQRIIRTVHGKGYEFVAGVTVVDDTAITPAPPPVEPSSRPTRLPAAVQQLIGRDHLLATLEDELTRHRLLTLVGTGGVGKTAAGYELARRVADRYPDGVHVVELVTVVDESATLGALATALDVSTRQQTSIEDAIVDLLRPRRALLLLDNCEHLVEPVAALVDHILTNAPGVSVIATSREPLSIRGEQVWTVDPLPTDAGTGVASFDVATVPAVALFVERARAADPTFVLDAMTAPAVVEICRRLDGIPLAIELAAARAIDVVEIATRLDERFRLLKGMRRDPDPRHRTLHDAISWSYDLLADDERQLFAALAVFAGQFDLGAAEAVFSSDDALDLLTRLSQRSMVVVRRRGGVGTRYELLETLREYGRRRLDDSQSAKVFTAHAAHFVALAKAVAAGQQTADELSVTTRAEASFADLRAAQSFLLQTADFDRAFALIGAVREFGMRALRAEVFSWAEAAAEMPAGHGHPLHPLMTAIGSYGAWVRGEYGVAVALADAARLEEQAMGLPPYGLVERVLANVYYTIGENDRGQHEAMLQIAAAAESGNMSRLAHACYMCSVASTSAGLRDVGIELALRARDAAATTRSPTDVAAAAMAQGFAADPDHQAALEAFERADRLAQSAGNRWMSAFARTETSGVLIRFDRVDEARAILAELVELWYRAGEWSQQWHTFARCMMALDCIGQYDIAAEVVGAIEAHASMGAPPSMVSLSEQAFATRDSLATKIGEQRLEERRLLGATRPLAQTIDRVRNALLGRPVDD